MKASKLLRLAIVVAAICATFPAVPARAQTELTLAMTQDAVSLDPIATSDNTSIWVQLLLFDTLVRPTTDGSDLEPGLAESWTASEDGLTYTFTLRDATFSDGSPVTSSDVVFSLERAGGEGSNWARFFAPLASFETPDERTVVAKLDRPFTPILNNLALFSGAVLPKRLVEEQGDAFFEAPVGSGPFALAEWRKGERIELVANPHYWQEGKPGLAAADLVVVPEGNARVLQLQAGEVDAAIDLPLNQLEQLDAAEGVNVAVADVFRTDLIIMNTRREPFDDQRVRQAMNHAIDKEGLVQGLLYGHGTVAASPMPVMAYADPTLEPYAYDPERARALMAEAGYPDGFDTSILVISSIPLHRQVGQAVQSYLAQVGVDAEIQLVEGGTHWATTKAGNYDMALGYVTSDTIDPDQLVGFLMVNPERSNAFHTEWKNERVNELYELERRTPNGEARGEMFREMIRIAREGAASAFLFHPGVSYGWRDGVNGFRILPTANFRLEDVTVD